jgi:hypothetical protein
MAAQAALAILARESMWGLALKQSYANWSHQYVRQRAFLAAFVVLLVARPPFGRHSPLWATGILTRM